MKTIRTTLKHASACRGLLLLALLLSTAVGSLPALAQSTTFSYQGRLTDAGQYANGRYDMTFSLYNVLSGGIPVAGPLSTNSVVVKDGLFTVGLDFGSALFDGTSYWVGINVRTNGGITLFTTLNPRQPLTPTPYAIYAQGADATRLRGAIPMASLSGTYGNPVTLNNTGNSFTGDGSGLTGVDADTLQGADTNRFLTPTGDGSGLTGLTPENISPGVADIDITGNAATAGYARYTGVASNAPGSSYALVVQGDMTNDGSIFIKNKFGLGHGGLRLGVDGGIATSGYLALDNNDYTATLKPSTDAMEIIGADVPNGLIIYCGGPVLLHYDQVDGGVATNGDFPAGCNTFTLGAYGQVLLNNPLSQSANPLEVDFESPQLVFQSETLAPSGAWNPPNYWGISQVSNMLTIGPMTGISNHLNGVEAGCSQIYVEGSVVPAIVVTTQAWVGIGTTTPSSQLEVAGNVSAGSFITLSDRNAKDGFSQVNARKILEAVAALPIQRWHFKSDAGTQHIGPMAQDFYAAFGVGQDEKHIATVDADGVALAAIQGLNQTITEMDAEIRELKGNVEQLKGMVDKLSQPEKGAGR